MTLHCPISRALTGPADHRHIPQTLDRITGISAVLYRLPSGRCPYVSTMSADSRRRQVQGHQYVWAFDRLDTEQAAEAASPAERAFARVEDAEGALASRWRTLEAVGVRELRLCERTTVVQVVQLPLPDNG